MAAPQDKPEVLPEPYTFTRTQLEEYVAPQELRDLLPYYLAGKDNKGRPVMVIEFGKWNARKVLETFPDGDNQLRLYQEQFFFRVGGNSTWADTTNGYFLIADSKDYSLDQITNLKSMKAYTRGTQLCEAFLDMSKSSIVMINVNTVIEKMLDLMKPFTKGIISFLEIYNSDSEKFIPRLLQDIPASQLPEAYGGSKDFKPARNHK